MGGIALLPHLFFGFIFDISNCTFTNNSAQFGGIIMFDVLVSSKITVNIINSTFLYNYASKPNTYLLVDHSQGGCFAGFLGNNTSFSFFNSIFGKSYSVKG